MKTSNKILLIIFLVPVLVVASVNMVLYAKYKSGNYKPLTIVEEERFTSIKPGNISKLALYGLDKVTIMSGTTASIQIEKGARHLHYSISGDSLVIHGDTLVKTAGKEDELQRSYEVVKIVLPAREVRIDAVFSSLHLHGNKNAQDATSYQLKLSNSAQLDIAEIDDSTVPAYFNTLTIDATKAERIEFTPQTHINAFQLNIKESVFADGGAAIGKLVVNADSNSSVTLKGDNLQKMNGAH